MNDTKKLLGQESKLCKKLQLTPMIFISLIAFYHGIMAVYSLSIFFIQKRVHKLTPAVIQTNLSLLDIPWGCKPLIGYLIDIIIPKTKNVKSIFCITAVTQIFIYLFITKMYESSFLFVTSLFFIQICSVFENIICEYFLMILTQKKNKEGNNNHMENFLPFYYGCRIVGQIIGTFISGRIIQNFELITPFKFFFFFPLILFFCALNLDETEIFSNDDNFQNRVNLSFIERFKIFWSIFKDKRVVFMIIIVFLINFAPSMGQGINFYYTDIFKISEVEFADINTISLFFMLGGLLCYQLYLIKKNPKNVYLLTNFLLLLLSYFFIGLFTNFYTNLGIDNKMLVYVGSGVSSMIGEVNLYPLLAIVCYVCPKNVEATTITFFTAMINFSNNISGYFGSLVMYLLNINQDNLQNLWIGILVANIYSTITIIILFFIDFPKFEKDEHSYDELKDSIEMVNQLYKWNKKKTNRNFIQLYMVYRKVKIQVL